MVTCRRARPLHFIKLAAIKSLICLAAGLALYGQFVSFHIQIPLVQVLALSPLVVAIGNSPFSPGGIGTTQVLYTAGFAGFCWQGRAFRFVLSYQRLQSPRPPTNGASDGCAAHGNEKDCRQRERVDGDAQGGLVHPYVLEENQYHRVGRYCLD